MSYRSKSNPMESSQSPILQPYESSADEAASEEQQHTLQASGLSAHPSTEVNRLPFFTENPKVQTSLPSYQPNAPAALASEPSRRFERTQTSAPAMMHPMMLPSFTGTTALEAMRYKKPFLFRVWQSFRHNNILLMAGGVAYNMLLSIIPLFALIFVALSQFFEQKLLTKIIASNLKILIPGDPKFISLQLSHFANHPELFGGVTLLALIFFSSLAFSMLENAMSVIFVYDKTSAKRRFWVSATLPYLFITFIFLGILLLTGISTALDNTSGQTIRLFGWTWSIANTGGLVLHIISFLGLGLMLASLYMTLPKCPISLWRALIGGFVAATLWEITRRILVFYFLQISVVPAIYGSLGNVIVVLLSFEVAAIIVLFGAQVIAELQRAEIFKQMMNEENA